MERYLCIHGHFYQPPRENPWLEAIEIQDSAYPYHDWNERITAECYAPNSASRNVDSEGRILDIVSNYSRISFNFGPTLLSWMQKNLPELYEAVLAADSQSIEWRSGHGNAIAQVYNHMIMPLANSRDKRTQVIWGIKDFEYRFGRSSEGMWLAETAVDAETLDILAEYGIRFTILAPRQASQVRKIGTGKWKDVSGSAIDPARAYLFRLPSGREINLFFYDGPISQAVAFENLLKKGDDFANRLLSGFSDSRGWPQLLHIATDGETYGHHQKFGDMALAYALNSIESNGLARLTNYGEYLEHHPPTHEVRIFENSSWSCVHGTERWKNDCGCNSGLHPGWSQAWRGPLREALDWLRDRLVFIYENIGGRYLKNPWNARDAYIKVLVDRSPASVDGFLNEQGTGNMNAEERKTVLLLLEMQRHAMLMYTSCGWFFDELSGIETVQVMQYAGRAIQLSEEVFTDNVEDSFKGRLSRAKSNIPEYENGSLIYDRFVRPAVIDLRKVGAHYAISSVFDDYPDEVQIGNFIVRREDYQRVSAGITKLAVGRISVSSDITEESGRISFAVLHFGGHALNGGVRIFLGSEPYEAMKSEILTTFGQADFAEIVRLMDQHFGTHNYSLADLFRDQQRTILNALISRTVEEFEYAYRQIFENNRILMGFLLDTGMPVKKSFLAAAEETLNADLKKALQEDIFDAAKIQGLLGEMKKWNIVPDPVEIEFIGRRKIESVIGKFCGSPGDHQCLSELRNRLELMKLLPVEFNYWQTQNAYYKLAKTSYRDILLKAKSGDEPAMEWIRTFTYLGELLYFNVGSVLQPE